MDDPGSVEVNRRARRAKTDRIDAEKLVSLSILHDRGEANWSLARVPNPEEDDARRVHRELRRLNKERTSLRSRIHSVLTLEGLTTRRFSKLERDLETMCRWDHAPLHRDRLVLAQGSARQRALEMVQRTVRHQNESFTESRYCRARTKTPRRVVETRRARSGPDRCRSSSHSTRRPEHHPKNPRSNQSVEVCSAPCRARDAVATDGAASRTGPFQTANRACAGRASRPHG